MASFPFNANKMVLLYFQTYLKLGDFKDKGSHVGIEIFQHHGPMVPGSKAVVIPGF